MCSLEFPGLDNNIYKKFGKDQVAVVGINPGKLMMGGEPPGAVAMFKKQTGVSFPLGYDKAASYKHFMKRGTAISPFPLDVIIDQKGKIAYVSPRYDHKAMVRVVQSLVGKR